MAKAIATLLLCLLVYNIGLINGENSYESYTDQPQSYAVDDDSPSKQEDYVTVNTKGDLCTGCITDINPNVENLTPMVNTAIKDIQNERDRTLSLIQVLQVQRQVVAGVRFTLVLEIGQTTCPKNIIIQTPESCPIDLAATHEYCKIDFLQKPWLTKEKFIIANNCTKSYYSYPEISKPDVTVPNNAHTDIMTEDRLLELESQIISDLVDSVDLNIENSEGAYTTTPDNDLVTDTSDKSTKHELSSDDKLFLDSFFGSHSENTWDEDKTRLSVNNPFENVNVIEENVFEGIRFPENMFNGVDKSLTSESNGNSDENNYIEQNTLNKRSADPSPSKDSKSSDTSIRSEENPQGIKRTANNSKEVTNLNSPVVNSVSNEASNSVSSEERRTRVRRGTKDSRAQSSLEKNDEKQDISINTLIKNNNESTDSSLSSEDDSITRHKRNADSSSSSSSSSSQDADNNNNNNVDNNRHKQTLRAQDVKVDNDPNSSSSDDNNGRDNKNKRSIDSDEYDEKVLIFNLAKYVTSLFDYLDDDEFRQIPLSAIKQRRSILEGYVYSLKLTVGFSNCKEEKKHLLDANLLDFDSSDIEECQQLLSPNIVTYCKVHVHVSETFTNPKLLDSKCEKNTQSRTRRMVPGGVSPAAVTDQHTRFVEESLALLDGQSEHSNKYKLVEIESVTKQVVAGMKYTINAKIALSDCPKSSTKNSKTCELLQDSAVKKCTFVIWDRPWITPGGRETSVKCDDKEHKFRIRRQVRVGGINSLPEDDPFILELTEDTLTKLDGESTNNYKYKIDKILAASRQVVQGIIYRIKARVVFSDCPKGSITNLYECGVQKEVSPKICEFEIWDRPWLPNGRETNVTCDGVNSAFRSRRSLDNTKPAAFHFMKFMTQFNKKYTSKVELKKRYAIFLENLRQIKLLNDFELGTAKYGVTIFADLTREEFKKYHLGLNTDRITENEIPMAQAEIPDIELPTEFDWRDKGAVTNVKNQGSCGSCWAFSTTGNIEGQYAIKHGKLLEFSEQELVDCDSLDEGCGGGLMDNAYREIEKLGGLELESDYPYDAKNEKCHFNKTLAKVQLSGALNISQNEDDMAKWLTQNGPIAIAINANAMQFYVGGVSHPWKFLCNPKSLDHGVLIVGYGVHTYPVYNKTLPYWTVKNSWGTKWGEQGYYRVYRGDGTCGVNQTPSSGIVE